MTREGWRWEFVLPSLALLAACDSGRIGDYVAAASISHHGFGRDEAQLTDAFGCQPVN